MADNRLRCNLYLTPGIIEHDDDEFKNNRKLMTPPPKNYTLRGIYETD